MLHVSPTYKKFEDNPCCNLSNCWLISVSLVHETLIHNMQEYGHENDNITAKTAMLNQHKNAF